MRVASAGEIGMAVSKKRKKSGYTQKEVAEATGLSASFISDVENGKQTAEIGKIIKLVHCLGMDIEIVDRESGA